MFSKTAGGSAGRKSSAKNKIPQEWLKILYWGLVLSSIYFAYLNIQPYEQAVRFLSGKVVNQSFIYLVSVIPIINGIANFIGKGVTWILGTLLWVIIQIIEVLPLVLYSHEGFIQQVISEADSRSKYEVKDTDDPTLAMLKRTYNAFPVSLVSNLERLKIVTYTVDFLICITVYSPVSSGKFSDFFWFVGSGQWNKLNYGNLALTLVTLFAIEIILGLIIWVGKLSYAIKAASK
ncbi:hypothetical protein PI95_034825 [Hassallia byssoidea VB512170]|uniref:Uncharacterized protein n=1 Tax=Hassallia byssoidea VB512170 TaxID=1304833 RepID=A0A846HJF5_9CYAN|nr:hypothetical protein [Hassalia byssoidea]NEU77492.1 hypothetical protein [Hassalia byssoidea VB512170]